jgi:hypothetical protein
MASTVKIKRSAIQGKVPTTGDLQLGELAVNTYDGKLYTKKSVGGVDTIVELSGGAGGGGNTTTISTSSPGAPNQGDTWVNMLTGVRFMRDGSTWAEF